MFVIYLVCRDIRNLTSAIASFYEYTLSHKFGADVTAQSSRESTSEILVTDTFMSTRIHLTHKMVYYL